MNDQFHTLQKYLARSVRYAASGIAIFLCVTISGCPKDECDLSEARCDGNVAIGCFEPTGKGIAGNQSTNVTCALPQSCFAGDGYAVCALKAAPCDRTTFVERCEGELPVMCSYAEGDTEDKQFEILGSPCKNGNTCVAGGCGVPGDMTCDPKTYAPSCDQGTPTICTQMGELTSDRYRVAYAREACKDGNQCFSGTGYAGCGRDGTQCSSSTFVRRCEGDSVVLCGDTSMLDPKPPFIGLEYLVPCAKGCVTTNGIGECTL